MCHALAVLVATGVVATDDLHAQGYPSRNIRAVVPFAPAGVTDIVARIVFDAMSPKLGQPVVVENRPGASGTIATEFVADAAPDGYTLLVNDPSGPLATNVSLYASRNFDPVKRLTPIAMLGTTGAIVAVPSTLPVKTLKEFVAYAKTRPKEILFGSTGIGTPGHLNGELFKSVVGIQATHVPYRVGTQGVTDLLSGRLTFWVIPLPSVISLVKEGRIRVLAVAGETRLADLPDVPTVAESGFAPLDLSTMYAIFAPVGTSSEIVTKLSKTSDEVLRVESVRQRLQNAGVKPLFASGAHVKDVLQSKISQWSDVIRRAGIEPH
jgi:tripartite-type tricarboxylate transporter receptor subunit TctC